MSSSISTRTQRGRCVCEENALGTKFGTVSIGVLGAHQNQGPPCACRRVTITSICAIQSRPCLCLHFKSCRSNKFFKKFALIILRSVLESNLCSVPDFPKVIEAHYVFFAIQERSQFFKVRFSRPRCSYPSDQPCRRRRVADKKKAQHVTSHRLFAPRKIPSL